MRGFVSFILELLFPSRCVVCDEQVGGHQSGVLVPAGWPDETIDYMFYSGRLLVDTCTPPPSKVICKHCLFKLEPADRLYSVLLQNGKSERELHVVSPFYINDTLLAMVHDLKFSGVRGVSSFLSWWMHLSLKKYIRLSGINVRDLIIIPVPLHRSRKRERGYNQSELIARGIANMLGVNVSRDIIVRKKKTKKQSKLSHVERTLNVKGAFELIDASSIEDRVPVLVDDLVTTGSTVLSCAEALSPLDPPRIIVVSAGRSRTL